EAWCAVYWLSAHDRAPPSEAACS
ncbi:hypothetical protein CEXT_211301, partial [Caerostris extrusa]